MLDVLRYTFLQLIESVEMSNHRYLYEKFDISHRLIGIIGQRGTGKTTLMLQYIKNNLNINDVFYVSLDHIYFNDINLFDFVKDAYQKDGLKIFFLDEVHKYKNWQQELKNIYDSFPNIKIIFSGSSSIDLIKGMYDLSRRAIIYHLNGLSFREFLNFKTNQKYPVISFDDLIRDYKSISLKISQIERIKGYFQEYLKGGYYPFIFEGEEFYYSKLANIIDKTIFEDISSFYNLKTENLVYFKKILYFLATIPPGKMNIHNLAKHLKIDDKTVLNYIDILQKTGLVKILFSDMQGSGILRNPEKVILDNTSMYHAISYGIGREMNIGMAREIFFVNALTANAHNVFYSKSVGDYWVNDFYFEIGGKYKNKKQIKDNIKNAFIVKDDILIASDNIIPLLLFGFLY